ncbi:MAG: glycerophosphodiester phosphodiesterase [Erysipelotrichales bacterium]
MEYKARPLLHKFNILVLGVMAFSLFLFNILFLNGLLDSNPKVISHRGVDSLSNPNGVQNTIPSLIKTSKLKPDYIEIDVQETKDNQFVMMHDNHLDNLAGVSGTPQDYTLAQLKKMKVSENDMEAPLASFDDYLKTANNLNQKLLIEIKTTKRDSDKFMDNFIKQYKDNLISNKHQIQSLDFDVITKVKKLEPRIPVSYIMPYNLVYPNTNADMYTMEETTLNDSFVIKSLLLGKEVYAWTVNTSNAMDKVMFMNVDGIISDEVSMLQDELETFHKNPKYADRIIYYISVMPD